MARKSVIPFGPQHPVLPEPLHLRLELEDEKVIGALPSIGYIHRGLEKIAEQKDYIQDAFLIERTCGICSFIHSLTYCQGVEALLKLEVPPRARYLRTIWSELHRIHSHLLWLGLLADAFGFENLFMQAWRSREEVIDLMEATAGARIMLGTCCVGGVRRDLSEEQLTAILKSMDTLHKQFDEMFPVILNDYSVQQRLRDVGKIGRDDAYARGAVGPVARASGIARDFRETGYAAYGELSFAPIVETAGDCCARLQVRLGELYQCLELVRAAVKKIPAGDISVPAKGNPEGEYISRTEQPRGEVMYYLKGNGTKILERLRIRTPTFANIAPLLAMLPGCELADVPVIVISIDPCISCTER